MDRHFRRRPRGDGGTVTAETAVVLPALVVMLAIALWGVGAAVAQMRCVDAARAAARAVARGENVGAARAAAAAIAPDRATIAISPAGRDVRVEVSAGVPPPGPGFARLELLTVRAAAVAEAEAR
jgi:Flp pilus assembly protein TadG